MTTELRQQGLSASESGGHLDLRAGAAGLCCPSMPERPAAAPGAIPGKLTLAALSRLHFTTLDQGQQEQAIRRLASTGMTDYGISHATGWSVEAIRRCLAEQVTA